MAPASPRSPVSPRERLAAAKEAREAQAREAQLAREARPRPARVRLESKQSKSSGAAPSSVSEPLSPTSPLSPMSEKGTLVDLAGRQLRQLQREQTMQRSHVAEMQKGIHIPQAMMADLLRGSSSGAHAVARRQARELRNAILEMHGVEKCEALQAAWRHVPLGPGDPPVPGAGDRLWLVPPKAEQHLHVRLPEALHQSTQAYARQVLESRRHEPGFMRSVDALGGASGPPRPADEAPRRRTSKEQVEAGLEVLRVRRTSKDGLEVLRRRTSKDGPEARSGRPKGRKPRPRRHAEAKPQRPPPLRTWKRTTGAFNVSTIACLPTLAYEAGLGNVPHAERLNPTQPHRPSCPGKTPGPAFLDVSHRTLVHMHEPFSTRAAQLRAIHNWAHAPPPPRDDAEVSSQVSEFDWEERSVPEVYGVGRRRKRTRAERFEDQLFGVVLA